MEKEVKWVLDPVHSEILFKVKHLMITNIKGEFRKVQGEMITNGSDFNQAAIQITIDTSSVYTNDETRDGHLRSADFFEVAKFKEIAFKSTSFKKLEPDNYHLSGLLTIKGISKEVGLAVEFGGINKDPWGQEKAGFSVAGTINRKDWGLNWNTVLETGGVLVGEEVKISAEVQFIRKG
jgi:polyisoprenoid-binding protein YceI